MPICCNVKSMGKTVNITYNNKPAYNALQTIVCMDLDVLAQKKDKHEHKGNIPG